MLKIRLIPVMLLREGILVKSYQFNRFLPVGNPLNAIRFFNQWDVDEILFLDITPNKPKKLGRVDDNYQRFATLADYTQYIAKHCFVPLTVGGGVKTIEDMRGLFNAGADKVVINTLVHRQPEILQQAAASFGRQALVVSIDVKKKRWGKYEVVTGYGKEATGKDPVAWAKTVEGLGAGEIFLTSMDRDGTQEGYDLKLLRQVAEAVGIPVIASGGVGKWQDLVDGVKQGKASAVAAANIFHFSEMSTVYAKKYMQQKGLDVRI
ncbi:MAG: hypothetical protein A2784_04060 [Candidatus Chisholmbacteria bacterium RIFCSPHIGHO2_01_FULL_48_12]|uniref:imidazole glycerol-phosphate synthase n=1 Tax=Candidatus Chisholmbacteria bacterium RIFCSPHIGHO2_01_FULL_48_12 TaxID=1797589 RepID=A0A1G1VP42_9BACT|nr:MAG: hypothetical protein A2784_04060 [Candidatus Chisholmbacteria bacterium RIFCSPHIGHO2_01_FULL_48_12]